MPQTVAKTHTMWHIQGMKRFDWNEEKNAQLARERGVTFQEVVYHIAHGGILDIVEHGNQRRYPGQRVFIVNIENYAFLVPFVEDDECIFMKTIIPSRKMTRLYLRRESE
jgi:uncharacterized DUF497 family protein